jgi:D-glycero-alpha-D-manno-heptose-7-phosphate kinase
VVRFIFCPFGGVGIMIITQAPVRISFLGGGTDFPEHFERHGGAVLATAVDAFAYVTVQDFNHKFFDHGLRIAYRQTERARTASDVEHPAIRACLQKLDINEGIELHHMADLPARTGLGSSSSFVVSMLQALHAHLGRYRSAEALATEAIEVERVILREAGGLQDQIIAAFGGTCLVRFERNRRFHVTQLPLSPARLDDLQRHMLLLYTGVERDSFTVLGEQVKRTGDNRHVLCALTALVDKGAELLASDQPIAALGHLLHQGWELKRSLSNVSLPMVDAAYEIGLAHGATGGKLLGAGQGGFLLFIADPRRHDAICAALPHMEATRVTINAPGSRVIFSNGFPDRASGTSLSRQRPAA